MTWQQRGVDFPLGSILALDARACLRECPRPLLYLAGSRDRIVPSWNAREVVRVSPSTKVVTIDGPYLALYTNPGAATRAIVGFMTEEESARLAHAFDKAG